MTQYTGQIKTKKQAHLIADAIEKYHSNNPKAMGMVSLLRSNWESIAARPAIQPEIIAMANTTGLDHKNSIMSKLCRG